MQHGAFTLHAVARAPSLLNSFPDLDPRDQHRPADFRFAVLMNVKFIQYANENVAAQPK